MSALTPAQRAVLEVIECPECSLCWVRGEEDDNESDPCPRCELHVAWFRVEESGDLTAASARTLDVAIQLLVDHADATRFARDQALEVAKVAMDEASVMADVIEAVEWSGGGDGRDDGPSCPSCGGLKYNGPPEDHAPDCALHAALVAAGRRE